MNTQPTFAQNVRYFFSDSFEMVKRNLIHYKRSPRLLFFSSVQPIMFVLLFAYVFGGAIAVPGGKYINYLIPAIIMQTVLFGATNTGIGLAEDLQKGLIDRFRSLPMSRAGVLAGRTLADSTRNVFTICTMILVGYIIGFRVQTDFLHAVAAVALAVLFGFAIMWIMATLALLVKESESVQLASFLIVFPSVFASSAFVPTSTMPAGLKWFAEHSPVTYSINTLRGLFITGNYSDSIWWMVLWIVAIFAIFFPLAVLRYKKAA